MYYYIMGAGILNLITNSGPQNRWINQDPQITFFKKVYRRHTPFAMESIPLSFNSKVDFGSSAQVTILPHGDLAHRMYFSFDLPVLAARFLKSKTEDIFQIINSLCLTDIELLTQLKRLATSHENIELEQIFNLIDEYILNYDNEQQLRLNILNELENYRELINDPTSIKINLATLWTNQKKEYYLIYELMKLIYLSEKTIIDYTSVTDACSVPKTLVSNYIFSDLIPNPEIFTSFLLSNHSDIAGTKLIGTDTQTFMKNFMDEKSLVEKSLVEKSLAENFYEFGPDFHYMLNSYNTIINVINSLATTVPIVLAKAVNFGSDCRSYYPTIIDPNFKTSFILKVNNTEKPIENNFFVPIEITNINDKINSHKHINPYLNLFNNQSNQMFNNIQKMIDILFESYECLFYGNNTTTTNRLFFNNSSSVSNIYSYVIPTYNPILDGSDQNLKISNVFNANIWYFYFFKYLDTLDASGFTNYVSKNINSFDHNCMLFMKNLIILLKINIEYYMNEISYLLNDLYASSPSVNPSVNMKNYIPVTHNTTINGMNICHDLMAVTLIFHRNHVPTIVEMFEFIYHFIENIDVKRINKYLDVCICVIDTVEMSKIKLLVTLFYRQIFGYFMNIYDNFHFDTCATNNCDTSRKCINEINIIDRYVKYFLTGNNNDIENYQPTNLSNVIQQMEFYFSAETIHMRQTQKLYSVLFDQQLIETTIGSTTANIIKSFNDRLQQLSNENNLYYATTNIDRYQGQSYLNTPYISRNHGLVKKPAKPFPIPATNPHGINSRYYTHNHIIMDYAPLPITNDNILNTDIPVYWVATNKNNSLSYYHDNNSNQPICINSDINYFKIKHEIFFHQCTLPKNIKTVDEYQFNLLRLVKLTEHLEKFPIYDKDMLHWLSDTLYYLVKHSVAEISDTINEYLIMIEQSIDNYNITGNIISPTYISEMVIFTNNLFDIFNNSCCQITLDYQHEPYTLNDLMSLNHNMKNIDPMLLSGTIDGLNLLRDHYVTQYFYYIKYYRSISQIWKLQEISDSYIFKNINQISCEIMKLININQIDLTILENLSSMVVLYPDMFPESITNLLSLSENMDDFSMNIFKYLMPFLSDNSRNCQAKITFKDIYDLINCTFTSIKQIWRHDLMNENIIMKKLMIYQPVLVSKLSLSDEIMFYLNGKTEITNDDIDQIAKKAESHGIDYHDYFKYLQIVIPTSPKNNMCKLLNVLKIDLDYFFIKWHFGDSYDGMLKNYIIENLNLDSNIKQCFNLIDNDYYVYIYIFLTYVHENNLIESQIKNPLIIFNQIHLIKDYDDINKYYNSFCNVSNIFEYLMDYVWDCSMTICHKSPMDKLNVMDYDKRFSLVANKTMARNKIIELSKDVAQKGIVVTNQQQSEILNLKRKIQNVMYRNKAAKCAWIRKLGHFVIKEVTVKFSDQICDCHISDWFETSHEISKNAGTVSGYNKMICHREDLIVFNDKIKKSYTVTIPLIFYFNKHIASSLPLSASINTRYDINIQLRSLSEVTYREEFSDFIDPNNANLPYISYIPTIKNPHLMVDYIYLSNEERKIFSTRRLEYLIRELQYDISMNVTDNTLTPIYKIGTIKKSYSKIDNKKKIKIQYYDNSKGIFMDQNEFNTSTEKPDLLVRNDYLAQTHIDQTGIPKTMMVLNNIPTNPYIHKKRIIIDNHFNNPTEYMIVLIKPVVHTDLSKRLDESNYFYGERQWDNYGLYSYYNLSKINNEKNQHYQLMKNRLNDLEDPIFGFMNVINQLLADYCEPSNLTNLTNLTNITNISNNDDKWIITNSNYFLELISTIKEAYMNYHDTIIYNNNIIRLRENILSLSIDYHITNIEVLYQLTNDVIILTGGVPMDTTNIHDTFMIINPNFDIDNLDISINEFLDGICELVSSNKIIIQNCVKQIYEIYNEAQINLFIDALNKIMKINDFVYSFENLMFYFNNFYLSVDLADRNIISAASLINKKLSMLPVNKKLELDTISIKNLTYKDVIYQIMENTNQLIPQDALLIICNKMISKQNQLINDFNIDLIDYQKNMIPNPQINPLLSGYMKFNDIITMAENSDSTMWSELESYKYFNHTPSLGINLHSWSIDPLNSSNQPAGSINLSRLDNFKSIYDLHPLIGNSYPVNIVSMATNINIMRYIAGMCGKTW